MTSIWKSNPPTYITNTIVTNYNPGILNSGTTYYWQINSKNTTGTTIGIVWQFITLAPPPQVTNPNPANGATGISINQILLGMHQLVPHLMMSISERPLPIGLLLQTLPQQIMCLFP